MDFWKRFAEMCPRVFCGVRLCLARGVVHFLSLCYRFLKLKFVLWSLLPSVFLQWVLLFRVLTPSVFVLCFFGCIEVLV